MIEILNDDCLFYIFRYLTFPDLINLEQVSARLLETIQSYYSQIHHHELFLRTLDPKHVEPIIERIGPSLRSFRFSGGFIMNEALKDTIIQSISSHCTSLTNLRLNYLTLEHFHLEKLQGITKNLKELNLGNIPISDKALEIVLTQVEPLKILTLNGNSSLRGSCLVGLKQVEKLDVSYCYELDANRIFEFLKNCSRLKHLNISGCSSLSRKRFYEKLLQHQPNIEELLMKNLGAKLSVQEKFEKLVIFEIDGGNLMGGVPFE